MMADKTEIELRYITKKLNDVVECLQGFGYGARFSLVRNEDDSIDAQLEIDVRNISNLVLVRGHLADCDWPRKDGWYLAVGIEVEPVAITDLEVWEQMAMDSPKPGSANSAIIGENGEKSVEEIEDGPQPIFARSKAYKAKTDKGRLNSFRRALEAYKTVQQNAGGKARLMIVRFYWSPEVPDTYGNMINPKPGNNRLWP